MATTTTSPLVGLRRQATTESLLQTAVATRPDAVVALARIVLGAILIPHGLQHLTGAWGGPGLEGTTAFFTGVLQLPAVSIPFVIGTELIGGALLILGILGRAMAAAAALMIAGAAVTVHLPHGFFMNWFGNQGGEGFEYHLLFLALTAVVVRHGSGAWSVDSVLTSRREPTQQ